MEILSCINCAIANAYPDYSIAWVNRKEITDLDRNDKYQDGPNTNSGYTIPFGSQNLVNFLKNKSYVSNNQKYRLMLRYKERERERICPHSFNILHPPFVVL